MVAFRGLRVVPRDVSETRRIADLMLRCKLSGAELGRRVDVHENTVRNWRNGHTVAPGAVFAYLELLASLREIAR